MEQSTYPICPYTPKLSLQTVDSLEDLEELPLSEEFELSVSDSSENRSTTPELGRSFDFGYNRGRLTSLGIGTDFSILAFVSGNRKTSL